MERELLLDLLRAHRDNDSMPGIVSTGAARTDIHLCTKDIDKLALALVTPLGAQDNGDYMRAK